MVLATPQPFSRGPRQRQTRRKSVTQSFEAKAHSAALGWSSCQNGRIGQGAFGCAPPAVTLAHASHLSHSRTNTRPARAALRRCLRANHLKGWDAEPRGFRDIVATPAGSPALRRTTADDGGPFAWRPFKGVAAWHSLIGSRIVSRTDISGCSPWQRWPPGAALARPRPQAHRAQVAQVAHSPRSRSPPEGRPSRPSR